MECAWFHENFSGYISPKILNYHTSEIYKLKSDLKIYLSILSKEAVLIATLHKQDGIFVFVFQLDELLFQRSIFPIFDVLWLGTRTWGFKTCKFSLKVVTGILQGNVFAAIFITWALLCTDITRLIRMRLLCSVQRFLSNGFIVFPFRWERWKFAQFLKSILRDCTCDTSSCSPRGSRGSIYWMWRWALFDFLVSLGCLFRCWSLLARSSFLGKQQTIQTVITVEKQHRFHDQSS